MDGVSSDRQGTFDSIGDRCRMSRHLGKKKALVFLVRMLVEHARTPDNGGDNCGREPMWKWKAEARLCIGSGDELVDIALWVRSVDVVWAKLANAM